jgi:hypothetical protein
LISGRVIFGSSGSRIPGTAPATAPPIAPATAIGSDIAGIGEVMIFGITFGRSGTVTFGRVGTVIFGTSTFGRLGSLGREGREI